MENEIILGRSELGVRQFKNMTSHWSIINISTIRRLSNTSSLELNIAFLK